jgi:hypothetical protein
LCLRLAAEKMKRLWMIGNEEMHCCAAAAALKEIRDEMLHKYIGPYHGSLNTWNGTDEYAQQLELDDKSRIFYFLVRPPSTFRPTTCCTI